MLFSPIGSLNYFVWSLYVSAQYPVAQICAALVILCLLFLQKDGKFPSGSRRKFLLVLPLFSLMLMLFYATVFAVPPRRPEALGDPWTSFGSMLALATCFLGAITDLIMVWFAKPKRFLAMLCAVIHIWLLYGMYYATVASVEGLWL